MRFLTGILCMVLFSASFGAQAAKSLERYKPGNNPTPCVQAFLNGDLLAYGMAINKKSKGILTVSKDHVNRIYFNITLKSNLGKKDEPPIYLRFIKQKQLDITELLEYAEDGDEIYIEEFVPSLNKIDLNCSPASFTVDTSL
ncbi:MAG: hypothetical protein U0T77_01255 [Chitinophagales bacterium]